MHVLIQSVSRFLNTSSIVSCVDCLDVCRCALNVLQIQIDFPNVFGSDHFFSGSTTAARLCASIGPVSSIQCILIFAIQLSVNFAL